MNYLGDICISTNGYSVFTLTIKAVGPILYQILWTLLNDSYAKMCILKDIARVFPVNEAIIQRKNDVQNLFSKQTTQKIAALFALF